MSTAIDPKPGHAGPPVVDNRPTSVAAILGLVFGVLFWPLGLVLSLIGMAHTKPGRKKGRGLALAGLVVSAVFGLIGIIAMVALAGAASSTTGAAPAAEVPAAEEPAAAPAEPAPSAAQESEAPAAEPAKPAEPEMAGFGDAVRDGKFEFTVNGMDCGETLIGSSSFGAKAQGEFCIVDVKVANVGDKPQTFFGSNAKLYNAAGQEYSADTSAAIYLKDSSSLMEEINPGNALTGKIVFDVPKGADITILELHDSMFSGGAKVATK